MYLTSFAVAAALYATHILRTWRKHYLRAQTTGLPCVVVPGLPISPVMRILVWALFSLLKRLPTAWARVWTPTWLAYLDLMSGWHYGYDSYRWVGADAYVLVAPTALMIVTCAPDAIDEILHHRDVFPRPVELFGAISRYGSHLACSEGADWRRMRRPVSRAFGDRNNREVWLEALYQAPRMVRSWTPGHSIPLYADTRRISQNVISKAAFGCRLPWGDEPMAREEEEEEEETKHGGMSFIDASRGLVRNILVVIGLPEFLLRYAPSALLQQVSRYDVAFRSHIHDTIQRGRVESGGGGDDVLHTLLRGAGTDYDTLSDSDILGNSFLLILGGHETVATSMQLAMVFLALNTQAQKHVQDDIDRIVGQRLPEEWTYDKDLPQLLGCWVGAVMHEQLRLVPPVPFVLTRALGHSTITIDGVSTSIPDGTFVSLSQLGAHRNPKHWPHGPPANPPDPCHPPSTLDNDLEEFRPERWFVPSSDEKPQLPQLPGKNGSLFRPLRGVYFPFSDGARACVGRRFAQIEFAAVLAVIFRAYSIELDVREWVSDAELDRMAPAQRHTYWQEAAKRTRDTIRQDMHLILTMHLKQRTSLPIRLVERGHERFR